MQDGNVHCGDKDLFSSQSQHATEGASVQDQPLCSEHALGAEALGNESTQLPNQSSSQKNHDTLA